MVQSEVQSNPSSLLMTRIPVPPVCIRPSVVSETRTGTTEDDITIKLTEIITINDIIKRHNHDGSSLKTITEVVDQLQVGLFVIVSLHLII